MINIKITMNIAINIKYMNFVLYVNIIINEFINLYIINILYILLSILL
jgi:hypothetical protein